MRVPAAIMFAGAMATFDAHGGPWEVGGTGIDRKRKIKAEAALQDNSDTRVWSRPVVGYARPINDRMSFEATYGYGVIERPGYRASGGRDMDVKLKYQLAEQGENGLAWLIEPKLSIPLGDEDSGVGRGKYALEIPLRASRTMARITYTGELRYTHVLGGNDDQKLVGAGGLVEYAPNERWVVGIDLFGDAPANRSRSLHLRSNLAAKWRPNASFEIQGLLGRSVSNARGPDQTSYKLVLEYKY